MTCPGNIAISVTFVYNACERNESEIIMITIRLPKAEHAKAWRAMVEIGPVTLIAADPIYIVLPAHLELLTARGISYEVIQKRPRRQEKPRHGKAH